MLESFARDFSRKDRLGIGKFAKVMLIVPGGIDSAKIFAKICRLALKESRKKGRRRRGILRFWQRELVS